MGITLSSQTTTFLFSVVLGLILGLFFDVFKLTNVIFSPTPKRIFIKDIIYFVLSAIITFIFILIVNMGEIRIYIISGEIIGWLMYRLTFGNVIYKILLTVTVFIKKVLIRVKKYIISKLPKKQIIKLIKKLKDLKIMIIKKLKISINRKKSVKKTEKRKNVLKNNSII